MQNNSRQISVTPFIDSGTKPRIPNTPKNPNAKTPLPGSIRSFKTRSSTVQRRVILELPHDVADEARERILQDWCRANLHPHNTVYHAVLHRPPPGNDGRNWHAHIAICNFDVPRNPDTNNADIAHLSPPLPINPLCSILSRNAPGLGFKERNQLAKDTFRDMRQNYASLANEHLRNAASMRRYDPRSYQNQGVDITPGKHRGTDATALIKKGRSTSWNDHAKDWANAAAAAAAAIPQRLREDAKDAIENQMVLTSLSPQAPHFAQALRSMRPTLNPALEAAQNALSENRAPASLPTPSHPDTPPWFGTYILD